MTISIVARETSLMPAGKYYVGDLCYLLPDDIYEQYVGSFNHDGEAVDIKAGRRKVFSAFVASTAYGDGGYSDNAGGEYSVDAGILGVVQLLSADLIAEAKKLEADGHAKVIDFPEDFRVDRDEDGTFTFGHLTIETGDSDQEEEEEEDDWDDEEDGDEEPEDNDDPYAIRED